MCRQDGKLLFGLGVHPTADKTLARKRESVFAVVIDNGEFHIGAERSGTYWLPVHVDFIPAAQTDRLPYLSRKNSEYKRFLDGSALRWIKRGRRADAQWRDGAVDLQNI